MQIEGSLDQQTQADMMLRITAANITADLFREGKMYKDTTYIEEVRTLYEFLKEGQEENKKDATISTLRPLN